MKIRCTNKKCLYEWKYTGQITDDNSYITCPRCRRRIMIRKGKLTDTLTQKVSQSVAKQQGSLTEKPLPHEQEDVGANPSPVIEVKTFSEFNLGVLERGMDPGENCEIKEIKSDVEITRKHFSLPIGSEDGFSRRDEL